MNRKKKYMAINFLVSLVSQSSWAALFMFSSNGIFFPQMKQYFQTFQVLQQISQNCLNSTILWGLRAAESCSRLLEADVDDS